MSNIRDAHGLPVMNFLWSAALGSYDGVTASKIYGHINVAPDTESLIWDLAINYVFPTTSDVSSMALSALSINDKSDGTGAQRVVIEGLNTAYEQITEVVSTDGRTPVPLQEDFFRFNKAYVSKAGTSERNVNDIRIGTGVFSSNGKPETNFYLIENDHSVSKVALYTVPESHTVLGTPNLLTIEEGQSIQFETNFRTRGSTVVRKMAKFEWIVQYDASQVFPIRMEAGSDLWLTVTSGGGNTDVSAIFDIVLFENGLLDNTVKKF